MSILIKGMEMPKYCMGCKFCGSGSIDEFEYWCGLTGSRLGAIGDVVLWEDMRAADCPLVEVPTPHGRLIDADEAFIDADERGFDFWACDADIDSAHDFLRAQPTIIEAEEGNEE